MNTDKERRREASRKLAAVLQSPWEPGCVARAFATPGRGALVYTYQVWIDLEAARSPLLRGLPPGSDEEADAAFRAFGLAWAELAEEDALRCVEAMLLAIAEANSMVLRMQPEDPATLEDQGFGAWLPIVCLLVEYGIANSLPVALTLPVAQGEAALATMRANAGWKVKGGAPYKWRDAAEQPEGEARG